MTVEFTRRGVAKGFAALALAANGAIPLRAIEPGTCDPRIAGWVPKLRADLEAMAKMLTATLKPWSGPKRIFAPEAYGHRGSADVLATRAIQAAIDAAGKAGGGTVLLARGDYVSGTIVLRSNVRLEVAKGARLLASLDLKDYPEHVPQRPTVMDSNMGMNQSLIFAEACENVSLCGEGLIDGRGTRDHFPGEETPHRTPGRPFLIRFIDCKRVHIKDIHLKDAAGWMQNYLNCEDLLIEGINVNNQANVNNDGLDVDGCRRVIVRNCFICSEDDGMCFKGASQRPMEQVLVENCEFYSSCNALKFGTDSQGDFRKVLVRNCVVGGPSIEMRVWRPRMSDSGVSWEVVDGGTVEDILVTDVHIVRAKSPLFLRLGDRGRVRPEQAPPKPGNLRRIVYDRVTGAGNGERGSYFIGLPDKLIEDVVLRDVNIGVTATRQAVPDENAIDELRDKYPDAFMVGDITPAYGLWTRHIRGLTMIRVGFIANGPDPRPMILTKLDSSELCTGR